MCDDPREWPRGWEEHKKQQILAIARETTPLQRLQWVEEMLQLLGNESRHKEKNISNRKKDT